MPQIRSQFIYNRADRAHDVQIGSFRIAPDVVDFARRSSCKHRANRTAVVLDEQPVANLLPVAVNRQRLAFQRVQNHEGNELLGKLVRAIVVRAVGDQHRQPVSMAVRAHKVVAGRLRRGIRRIGRIGRAFGELPGGPQGAIHFIGGYMDESEGRLFRLGKLSPIHPGGLEQAKRPHNVGLHEFGRAVDGAVDMRFGREIDHRRGTMLAQKPRGQCAVPDVAVHEDVPGIIAQILKGIQVARVGKLVEIHNRRFFLGEPLAYEIASDETGASGHHDCLHVIPQFEIRDSKFEIGSRFVGHSRLSQNLTSNLESRISNLELPDLCRLRRA